MASLPKDRDSSQPLPRAWGSFQFEIDGRNETIRFTKQGDTSRAGYVFGHDPECDIMYVTHHSTIERFRDLVLATILILYHLAAVVFFRLPRTSQTSARHFVIYKEMVDSVECVFLLVLR